MFKASCLILFFMIQNLSWAQDTADDTQKQIEVVVGLDKIEKLEFAPNTQNGGVQVGNDQIVQLTLIPAKREITFRGLKAGKTSVILRDSLGDVKANFLVNVTMNDQSKVIKELRELLGDVEGLEIGLKGESVYVGGYIVVPSDIGKVSVVLDKYPDVMRLMELSPHTQRLIATKMQDEIQKTGLRDVTVRVVNNLFWLEGVVDAAGKRDRAYNIAAAYIPDRIESLARRTQSVQKNERDIIQNFIQVNEQAKPTPVPKMVKITAQFVELSKDYNKIFGFKWTPFITEGQGAISFGKTGSGTVSTNSGNGASQAGSSFSGTISNLFPKLSSAKAAGYARILQSGILIIKEGVAGNINKKEEKPFAIGSNEFTKSEKAMAGFDFMVMPTVLQEEKVDLNVSLSISTVVGDPPTTLSNIVKTQLVVKSKDSAVVGGIVVSKNSTDYDRNPSGGKEESDGASALFSFVRSKSYTNTRSQFVVFITPEIIDSASSGANEIKRKFRRRGR